MTKTDLEKDSLLYPSKKHGKTIDNVKWVDLVVERYEIGTEPKDNVVEAFLEAARLGERVLYGDINGALQLDMIPLWGLGGEHQKYPRYLIKGKDEFSQYRFLRWMISPETYVEGFDWIPYDGMQKFQVKTTSRKEDEKDVGILKIDAFVIDDAIVPCSDEKGPRWRLGCLADIINRNKKQIRLALGTRIPVPYDDRFKANLESARIFEFSEKPVLSSFNLTGEQDKIIFKPIDIEQRCGLCDYRDR